MRLFKKWGERDSTNQKMALELGQKTLDQLRNPTKGHEHA